MNVTFSDVHTFNVPVAGCCPCHCPKCCPNQPPLDLCYDGKPHQYPAMYCGYGPPVCEKCHRQTEGGPTATCSGGGG